MELVGISVFREKIKRFWSWCS